MTVKEAINELQSYADNSWGGLNEAFEIAISALEKQIPKKPFNKSNNPEDWEVMCCPTCNRIFWNSGEWVHYEPIICEKCGQYIDWSEQHPYRD